MMIFGDSGASSVDKEVIIYFYLSYEKHFFLTHNSMPSHDTATK